jgi:hypothetical protein
MVGIEQSANANTRARELAAALDLENITFLENDALDPALGVDPAAVVVSTVLLMEAEPTFRDRQSGFSSLPRLPALLRGGKGSQLAEQAARLLLPSGRFVSYERIGNAEALAAWFGALAAVGLGVDLASSAELPW